MDIYEMHLEQFPIYLNGNIYRTEWLKNIPLKTKYPVQVGIDQSSTSTGIAIQSPDLLFITELPRGLYSINDYKRVLTVELKILMKNLQPEFFIFEKHGQHITPLHSIINEITHIIKGFGKTLEKGVELNGVLPPVWRKGFLPTEDYKGRYKREQVKLASVEQAIKEVPDLIKYKKFSKKDYDGFEAYGIINGYLRQNFNQQGKRVVNTTMEYRRNRNFKYFIEKYDKFNIDTKAEEIKKEYNLEEILYCNSELLLENTLNRAMGFCESCAIVYKEHSEFPRFVLETKKIYKPNDAYLIVAQRG